MLPPTLVLFPGTPVMYMLNFLCLTSVFVHFKSFYLLIFLFINLSPTFYFFVYLYVSFSLLFIFWSFLPIMSGLSPHFCVFLILFFCFGLVWFLFSCLVPLLSALYYILNEHVRLDLSSFLSLLGCYSVPPFLITAVFGIWLWYILLLIFYVAFIFFFF